MFKRSLSIDDYLLILVNLIPVYGVWFAEWNAPQIFLVYCLETVIVGFFNVVKMLVVLLLVRTQDLNNNKLPMTIKSGIFLIVFFILHYGIFVFVQTQIFFSVSGIIQGSSFFTSYQKIDNALGSNGKILLMIFIGYYTLQTIYVFFVSGRYKIITIEKLMIEPYSRIFIQQFVVIIGSMFLLSSANMIFILIMAIVKICFELFFKLNFRKKIKNEINTQTEKAINNS